MKSGKTPDLPKRIYLDLLDVNADDLIRKPPHIEIEGEVNTTEIEDKMADMEFGGVFPLKPLWMMRKLRLRPLKMHRVLSPM